MLWAIDSATRPYCNPWRDEATDREMAQAAVPVLSPRHLYFSFLELADVADHIMDLGVR